MNDNFNDFYAAMITLVVALNSISIPVSYNIIAENFKQYLDESMYRDFSNRKEFQLNIKISVWALIFLAIPLFINFNLKDISNTDQRGFYECCRNLYFIWTIFVVVGFLIGFFEFSKLLYKFSTNSQEILFEQIQKNIDEFLE